MSQKSSFRHEDVWNFFKRYQRISTMSSFSVISLSTSFHDVKQKDARENNRTLLTGKEEASNLGAMQRQRRELHRPYRVEIYAYLEQKALRKKATPKLSDPRRRTLPDSLAQRCPKYTVARAARRDRVASCRVKTRSPSHRYLPSGLAMKSTQRAFT